MSHDSFDQIPEIALDWHQSGAGAVLATVVQTWGSAPRPVGAQLVVSGAGAIMGSVSGGCVEGAVILEAAGVLATGLPRLLTFGVSDDTAFATGLACGGTIEVLLDPVGVGQGLPVALLRNLCAARAARRPVALSVRLPATPDTGGHDAAPDRAGPAHAAAGPVSVPAPLPARLPAPAGDSATIAAGADWAHALHGPDDPALCDAFRADRSGMHPDGARFVTVFNPPLRLIVVGAVHIAQPLIVMARLAGYDPFLVDPRAAFASESRFPGQTICHDWPDDALAAQGLDRRTAVVTLTHEARLDDPAIMAALGSDVFYLGCLGSTRTHARRLERLRAAGLPETALARIHAPVGLNIGAKTPAEIAVSIMAELTLRLRGA